MADKVIAIDIGNSAASYGVFSLGKLVDSGYVESDNIPQLIRKCALYGGCESINHFIISSVVPQLTSKLERKLRATNPACRIWIVGRNVSVPLRMSYHKGQLGADRLVNLYGALKRYRPPLLIVDFGTAITFDYVSKAGRFEGGMIVPGVELSWRALQSKAALLRKTGPLKRPLGFLGRNTKQAMYSGIFYGYGALTDGLIERIRKRYGRKVKVIATGGLAPRAAPFVKSLDVVDPLHTIRSLYLIFKNETVQTKVAQV